MCDLHAFLHTHNDCNPVNAVLAIHFMLNRRRSEGEINCGEGKENKCTI
jgi:hypothetical protein